MKRVPWTDTGKGRFAPLLTVGFRRRGNSLPVNPILPVDTGADGIVLPRYNARYLGFNFRYFDLHMTGRDFELVPI